MPQTAWHAPRGVGSTNDLNGRQTRAQVVWAGLIGLQFVAISLGLGAAPEVAMQYWYLFAAPLILGAFRFGLRGALFTSACSVLVLTTLFRASGTGIGQFADLAVQVLQASTNPDDLQSLVGMLTDLRQMDVRTSFARALSGVTILCCGSIMLGMSIDSRSRITGMLERALEQLRRYFSPQVMQAILSQPDGDAAELQSTRATVTVLFCDLRGFTTFSEALEPETIAQALNEYFTAMSEEIFREDGTLDKYIGDAVMAVFGAPVAHPDHAERAFRCALAMQRRMLALQEQWREQGRPVIGMGIGLAVGEAVVGSMGSPTRREYTAIGSSVNIASRMTDLAHAGQIVTTLESYQHVAHLVGAVPRERTAVKGISRLLEIVEVVAQGGQQELTAATVLSAWVGFAQRCLADNRFRERVAISDPAMLMQDDLPPGDAGMAARIATLLGTRRFRSIPVAEVAVIAAYARYQEYPAGALLTQQGAAGAALYLVTGGQAEVMVQADGHEQRVGLLGSGDTLGEMALILDRERAATVRTLTPLQALVITRADFDAVMTQAPALRAELSGVARSRLQQAA
jgi:class 3 adenylate cyclase